MPDHVHMMISIPPKYAVSQVVGYIKGKSAIHMARVFNREKWAGPNVTFELVFFDGKGSSQESLLQLKSATDQGVRYIVQNLSSSVGLALIDASAEMALRWTATGFLEAEKSFRKVRGYRQMKTLINAIRPSAQALKKAA